MLPDRRGIACGEVAPCAPPSTRTMSPVAEEPTTNTVTVGPHEALAVRRIDAIRPTWAEAAVLGEWRGLVQVRAHGEPLPARIEGRDSSVTVLLDEPAHGIAPGQAVVCYDGERVVGSATIASTAR